MGPELPMKLTTDIKSDPSDYIKHFQNHFLLEEQKDYDLSLNNI